MTLEKLWEIGIEQGLGIFFFLFIAACAVFSYVVNRFWNFIQSVMQENENREQRYLKTIDATAVQLGDIVKELHHNVNELRVDVSETKKLVGRIVGRD